MAAERSARRRGSCRQRTASGSPQPMTRGGIRRVGSRTPPQSCSTASLPHRPRAATGIRRVWRRASHAGRRCAVARPAAQAGYGHQRIERGLERHRIVPVCSRHLLSRPAPSGSRSRSARCAPSASRHAAPWRNAEWGHAARRHCSGKPTGRPAALCRSAQFQGLSVLI